ncbi:MAG: enoyl-CoA hydratase/isomerase family protein [Acidimicrobiia bacterium]
MGFVQVERDGGVVTVTLSNPAKKNAVPADAWPDLAAVLREVAAGNGDRCLVLTGAGDDFCSGADVTAATEPGVHPLQQMRAVGEAIDALHALPQPAIARVAGVCVGIGLNMALCCDLVVAADDARFSEIFVRRGLSIDGGGSWSLPRVVGLLKAKELALLGDIVPAGEAERIGLVSRVVPRAELDRTVAELARRLAAGPPLALGMTKRLLDQSAQVTLAQAVEAEAQAQAINFSSRDTAEAIAAFVERREPNFEGH